MNFVNNVIGSGNIIVVIHASFIRIILDVAYELNFCQRHYWRVPV